MTFQAPYLEDPNTGIEMFESAEIIEYLRATYALQWFERDYENISSFSWYVWHFAFVNVCGNYSESQWIKFGHGGMKWPSNGPKCWK